MNRAIAGALFASFASYAMAGTPIGFIDQVVRENGQYRVKGWACQPGLGQPIQVRLYLNNQASGSFYHTDLVAESAVHAACGTNSGSGTRYRYSIPYTGTILAGQKVRIDATGPGGTAILNSSNQFGLPANNQTPDAVFSTANRVLLFVAHQDDEIVFSPFLRTYCGSGKSCKIVTATNDPARANEWPTSISKFPAQGDLGGFRWNDPNEHPSIVLQRWEVDALNAGLGSLNAIIANEIVKFAPDVIVTFDPRHGTSCHSEHRAVGEAVRQGVSAYTGKSFADKSKLYFLTTRRIDDQTDSGVSYMGLAPIAPTDNTSVVYSADDAVSFGITGWRFVKILMETYPSQFSQAASNGILSAPSLERTTAFQRVTDYLASDTRYTNAVAYYPRFFNCPTF